MAKMHEVAARLSTAKADRARFEPMMDDAMRLTMPGRRRFRDSSNVQDGTDVLDETGANAVSEFVSRMQAGMMPAFTEFLKLEAGFDVDPRDRAVVNRELDEINALVFADLWESNFQQEASEALYDMALSAGTLLLEDGPGNRSFSYRAVPITELYLERGADDRIGGQFREVKRRARDIPVVYPRARIDPKGKLGAQIARESDKEIVVIEYLQALVPGAGGEERCRFRVCVGESGESILDETYEGDGCAPFINFRWQTTAGEAWGRGPLLNALGAIRTTNLMVELVLENAAMSIVGIFQSDNDATVMSDNLQLVPGMILSREAGSNGLEQVRMGGNQFNMQDVVIQDQRVNIKRALFNDMLSDPNKTPATATEVVERMADLAHRTSAGFGRLHRELLVPNHRRALYLLDKKGDIELPKMRGARLSYRAVSPIAQAQEMRKIQNLIQDFQVRSMLLGPQAAQASYSMKDLLKWLEDRTGLDRNLYAKPEQIVDAMKKQAEGAMAAQMAMAQTKGVGLAQ